MGTSKGYIAPSTPYWSRAKRSVTSYLGNPSDNKRNSAASGYAKAMGSAGFSNNRAVHAFSGIASFAAFSGANGYQAALREIGRDDRSKVYAIHVVRLVFSRWKCSRM